MRENEGKWGKWGKKWKLLGPPQETAESEGAEQQQAQGGGRLLQGHPQIRQRGQYLHCCCPPANTAIMAASVFPILVFLLSVWQVESLPTLASKRGGGVQPIPMTDKLYWFSLFLYLYHGWKFPRLKKNDWLSHCNVDKLIFPLLLIFSYRWQCLLKAGKTTRNENYPQYTPWRGRGRGRFMDLLTI